MEYTIAAIPTVYRGRRYRSRLEARWAALFDLLGWQHEYEPCDLGSWSPDFALWGCRPRNPVLVEVKPITTWCRSTARKMADAVDRYEQPCSFMILLGLQPDFGFDADRGSHDMLGWLGEPYTYEAMWTEALFGTDPDGRVDALPNAAHFCQESLFWEAHCHLAACNVEPLWVEAANVVQWRGPGK